MANLTDTTIFGDLTVTQNINNLQITSPESEAVLTIAGGKEFSVEKSITLDAFGDDKILNIGNGGTLGSGAFVSIGDYAVSTHAHGNISSDGKIGETGGLLVYTGGDGKLSAVSAGSEGQTLRMESGAPLWADAYKNISGEAIFIKSSNQISMTKIVPALSLEVGDVIRVSSSVSNNRLFTVEELLDDDTIVVNYEHRDGAGNLSLADEEVECNIKLIAKWHSAPLGLGQSYVEVSGRTSSTTNTTNRPILVRSEATSSTGSLSVSIAINGITIESAVVSSGASSETRGVEAIVPPEAEYIVSGSPNVPTVIELR